MTYYLGIMSGTSLDGVDIALTDIHSNQTKLIAADFTPMPANLREKVTALIQSGETTLQALGELDHQFGCLYADCVNAFLRKHELKPEQVEAIGCHGQTVWHSPKSQFPFTMQIGDMNLLAAKTGITVVGDLRRKDMAFGGQGAPLVPAFHQAVFFDPNWATVVLNIGGISNISLLIPEQPVIGFDTGTGNALLDQWIEKHQGKAYDKNGEWAASGQVNPDLLAALLDEDFFQLPPPKSTGRELFNLTWLENKIQKIAEKTTALLALVGLSDKHNVYPANLSGGQKQRVAIARALASDPKVLLCDEATSALDPATTQSILKLLKEINRTLGITILLITHEMEVVKRICDQVAVIDKGRLIEQGTVSEIFSNPKTELAQEFISSTFHITLPEEYLENLSDTPKHAKSYPIIKFEFTGRSVDAPLLSQASKKFGVELSILTSQIDYAGGVKFGFTIAEVEGDEDAITQAKVYLMENNVRVEVLGYVQ